MYEKKICKVKQTNIHKEKKWKLYGKKFLNIFDINENSGTAPEKTIELVNPP